MDYVCDNCGATYHIQNIERFGPLKCHKCGNNLTYTSFQKNNSLKYRSLGLIFSMGVLVIFTFYFCSMTLGLIYSIMGVFSLTIGRYVDKNHESVTTDKLRKVSITIFMFSLLSFVGMIFVMGVNIFLLSGILLFLQIVFLGLFVGSSYEEISKPPKIHRSDKLNLKISELKEENVNGLEKILLDLDHLEKSDHFIKVINSPQIFELEDRSRNRAMQLADQIIKDEGMLKNVFPSLKNHIVGVIDFLSIYIFLERIYESYKGDKLVEADFNNIYFSGLDENIMMALDQFDTANEFFIPSADFFEKIMNMGWEDESSETFCQKFEGLREYYMLNYYDDHYDFINEENQLLKFLTVCSAYSRDRDAANKEDVIKSHETYMKLINTDLTQFHAKKEFLKFKAYVTKTIPENVDVEKEVSFEDENLKKVPRDVQFAFFITLLVFVAQIVNFVFNEWLMVHPKGIAGTIVLILTLSIAFGLSILSYMFLKYLGWDLFYLPKKPEDTYLVCLRCGGYYKLQPGEFVDDFDDKCECGGKLIQSNCPELQKEPTINLHYSFIFFFLTLVLSGLILYFSFKSFNIDVFELAKGQSKYYLNFLLVFLTGALIILLFRLSRYILGLFGVKLNLD